MYGNPILDTSPPRRCLLTPGLTASVSLQPVELDHPGEMGGRMASPTFVGCVEELQSLEAARG
jgi:hypothetical protein